MDLQGVVRRLAVPLGSRHDLGADVAALLDARKATGLSPSLTQERRPGR